jgi:hypothetical protein
MLNMCNGSFRIAAKATDRRRIVPLPLLWLPSTSSKAVATPTLISDCDAIYLFDRPIEDKTEMEASRNKRSRIKLAIEMSERKPTPEELAVRIDQLLIILKEISEDLTEISKQLKAPGAPAPATVAAAPAPPVSGGRSTVDIKSAFPKELEGMLFFEDKGEYIVIKPRQYLGSENFAKIASIVRSEGGEYISAGKESHFRVAKESR